MWRFAHRSTGTGPSDHGQSRGRNIENDNNITVVAGFDTVEAAQAFRDDPELKEAMGVAGVVGAPRFEIFEEVESVQY